MKLLVLSSAPLIASNEDWKAYSPYAKEMEIWARNADEILFCCPVWDNERGLLVSRLDFKIKNIRLIEFELTSFSETIRSLFAAIVNIVRIFKAMRNADHIHLRCPGNIGLLACIVQVFFPSKPKTAKYAGNWDPKSEQPVSYKLQKWILSNTFLTKNMQVLVYGEWTNQTRNIKSFFTATYTEKDKKPIIERHLQDTTIKLLFVGALSKGKRPLFAVRLAESLFNNGQDVQLKLYGEGIERETLEDYVRTHHLDSFISLMGNKSKDEIQVAYEQSHFLILPSQSEGWPKVVAEAMFWGSIPVASKVSCVPSMLGEGKRGLFLTMDLKQDTATIVDLIENPNLYKEMQDRAVGWSRKYTLDYFESEIKQLMKV